MSIISKLLDLITGNATAAIAVACALTGAAGAWTVQGWRLEALEGRWQARELVQVTAANKLISETQDKYRKIEVDHAAAQAATVAKFEKGKRDAQIKNDALLVDLRAGNRWLQFNVAPGTGASSSLLPSLTPGPAVGDGVGTVRLPEEVGGNLYALAGRANKVADQLRACQSILLDDRTAK